MVLESSMNKCRICLGQTEHLNRIHDIDKDKGISYVDMITSITTVKNIGRTDHSQICSPCQKRVLEAYDFKLLIESSDMILQDTDVKKVIKFSSINEIKTKLSYKEKVDFKPSLPIDLMKEIESGKISITYNNTIITKPESENKKRDIEIPVIDFLKSIKSEIKYENFDCNDIDDYSPNSDADEYVPWKPVKNKKTKRKAKYKAGLKPGTVCRVPIKPVLLEDVSVVYYDPQERIKRKKMYRIKYASRIRMDICCYCGKLTKSLKIHQLVHTGEKKFNCDVCPKTYFTQSQLNNHKKVHLNIKNYKCDVCVATFEYAHALRSHMKMHSDVISFFCNICNKGFKRKNSLTRHLRQHNSENRNVKCELCNMMFYSNVALRHHMRVHTGERPYKCEICSQPYSYKRDFNRHCFKKHGIFLKRRSVNIMNDEVLKRERALMKELLLRKQGGIKDDPASNPFEGPQAAMAFEQVMQVLENRPLHEDF